LKFRRGVWVCNHSWEGSYSSAGGNGWMGLNWSLSIPSVDIHTGWGVPRYDSSLETETYTLSGGFRFTLPIRINLRKFYWFSPCSI